MLFKIRVYAVSAQRTAMQSRQTATVPPPPTTTIHIPQGAAQVALASNKLSEPIIYPKFAPLLGGYGPDTIMRKMQGVHLKSRTAITLNVSGNYIYYSNRNASWGGILTRRSLKIDRFPCKQLLSANSYMYVRSVCNQEL